MKTLLLVVLGAALTLAAFSPEVTQQFIAFQHQYNKMYATQGEFNARLAIFAENLQRAARLNQEQTSAVFGVTKFMDMTVEEFKNTILMSKLPQHVGHGPYRNQSSLRVSAPNEFDWRDKSGVVTPVYNQGQCGSCWAFSATENIESRWALAGHPLTRLSMQQVVSCDTMDYGCDGGWPYHAYEYIHNAGGQDTYASYPYTAADTPCEFKKADIDAKVASWTYVTSTDSESEMVDYLYANGPLSVCVDAEQWMTYTHGVFLAKDCGKDIDHCVQATGYNLAANPPYWIIRNSWGTDWGEAGYMLLEYGKNSCAVAEVVTSSIPA
jgi:C1A family cysteine protease